MQSSVVGAANPAKYGENVCMGVKWLLNLANLAAAFCFLVPMLDRGPRLRGQTWGLFLPAPATIIWRPHRLPQPPLEEYLNPPRHGNPAL
jgi:hypothetical protein